MAFRGTSTRDRNAYARRRLRRGEREREAEREASAQPMPQLTPCPQFAFLPKAINGATVLEREAENLWRTTNVELQSPADSIAYRASKHLEDRMTATMKGPCWGDTIPGSDEGDGWVRVEVPTQRIAPPRLRGFALWNMLEILDENYSPDSYEILDVPKEARAFSSKLDAFGKVFDNSRLESDVCWAPGPRFREHGLNEYIVLDAGAPRLIGGVVISGCGCCSAHAGKVRLSVSLHGGAAQGHGAWIECGDHDCCQNYPPGHPTDPGHPGGQSHYDVLEIEPTLAQFVKINPREWREGENHAALRCALLIIKETLVVTLVFGEHGVTATNLAGEIILESQSMMTLAAISSSVKAITKHDGPIKLISADGTRDLIADEEKLVNEDEIESKSEARL